MDTKLFDYALPPEYIAHYPAKPRETAKLLYLNRKKVENSHHTIADLPSLLQAGDVLIVNNTKVFRARLHGKIMETLKAVELFLIRPIESDWIALAKPGKLCTPGSKIIIAEDFIATVQSKDIDGNLLVNFGLDNTTVIEKANIYGEIPLPPYIHSKPQLNEYQTAYAKHTGSVAAPTAGFHITKNIIQQLHQHGIDIVEITLHVGLGTFQPIRTTTIESHVMHPEWVEITEESATSINEAKQQRRRIIAVGTTSVRTLEGIALQHQGKIVAYRGDINIFITPGFAFQVIDGMLTNFHLPKSTLLVLISAFAGRQRVLAAYKEALDKHYRFYSFGDAMLII